MADIWVDVNIALANVPLNLVPLVGTSDGFSITTSLTAGSVGMDLQYNFMTTGGTFSVTGCVPAASGTYSFTHAGDGIYSIQMPASGGTGPNNNTVGFGWFKGACTGVLPWRSPVIGFRAKSVNDSLINASTLSVTINSAQIQFKKNVAFANFTFLMVDSSGSPKTGLTVGATRRIDNGSFAACANSVTEVAYGLYTIDLADADLNGSMITFRFTGSGASDRLIGVVTQA